MLEPHPAHSDDSVRTTEGGKKIHLRALAVCSPAVILTELKENKEFVGSSMPIILINKTT